MDEAHFGRPETGGAENKALTAIAVEAGEGKVGRMRTSIIEDSSSASLHGFIENTVEKGGAIAAGGWRGYDGVSEKGCTHKAFACGERDALLPRIHTTISLIKRWTLGALQGSCSKEHLGCYFDEYTFRFNRRKIKWRGVVIL